MHLFIRADRSDRLVKELLVALQESEELLVVQSECSVNIPAVG